MDGGIRELAERLWTGETTTLEVHPVEPVRVEAEEIEPGVHYLKGIAAVTTIDTGDGLVMLDTGARNEQKHVYESIRAWRKDTPLVAAVFSHHHVDHIFGTIPFEAEQAERRTARPIIYGHEAIGGHFDRYKRTLGWNRAINVRQFAIHVPQFQWPSDYRYPDVSYKDRLTFAAGDNHFELHHTRGETEDGTWTFVPERKLLHTGDLFIWAVPNAGNPQKVQRWSGEWAAGLRQMAACGAEILIPGHGLPIWGADRIRTALTETADLLEAIEGQVVAMMNTGCPLDRILHGVRLPAHLMERPYLRPVYDHPQFLIRNIWRLYGGWYEGEPDNLLPAPRKEQATEWVQLSGGLDRVLERVAALKAEGNLRMACHLVEYAVIAEPGSKEAHELRAEVYSARSKLAVSSMERNILNHAALASAQGKRDLAGDYDY
jgi:alkyl sulfatase BDS1-like metallo-beta-lactamase superfamily hydrolase